MHDTCVGFLMFSCAEYELPDIEMYLRMINDVPASYGMGDFVLKIQYLCLANFSLKFHAFFQRVLVKGEVLGTVDHFYWKKEYQGMWCSTLSRAIVDK